MRMKKLSCILVVLVFCISFPFTVALADAGPSFSISASPTGQGYKIGDVLTFTVSGHGIEDMYGFEIAITFDHGFLEYVSTSTQITGNGMQAVKVRDNNKLLFGFTKVGAVSGENGDKALCAVKFKVLSEGETVIKLDLVKIVRSDETSEKYAGRELKLSTDNAGAPPSLPPSSPTPAASLEPTPAPSAIITVAPEEVPLGIVKSQVFSDLGSVEWAREAIEDMASRGIIKGTGENKFSPSLNITRADYLLLLVRTLGLQADAEDDFDDVKPGVYYYEAVGIARKLGITNGVGNNLFKPKENISRQDMMVLTTRTLEKFKGLKSTSNIDVLGKFTDREDIAGYAEGSLATLVSEGLILGSGNKLNPRAWTTRAEAAVFMYRIFNKYL